MFKRGTFTIATYLPNQHVWGHVFIDRDLEEGATQIQHGVIYPHEKPSDNVKPKVLARGPIGDEPLCDCTERWQEQVSVIWGKYPAQAHHKTARRFCKRSESEQQVIYVVARARHLQLPFTLPVPLQGPTKKPWEQWDPESWAITHKDKVIGVLYVWEPAGLESADEQMMHVPTPPPDSDQRDRLNTTYELWYTFEKHEFPPATELHFSAIDDEDQSLPKRYAIFDGTASKQYPNAQCVITACSYYKSPQPSLS